LASTTTELVAKERKRGRHRKKWESEAERAVKQNNLTHADAAGTGVNRDKASTKTDTLKCHVNTSGKYPASPEL
jgi:hypothetical protein